MRSGPARFRSETRRPALQIRMRREPAAAGRSAAVSASGLPTTPDPAKAVVRSGRTAIATGADAASTVRATYGPGPASRAIRMRNEPSPRPAEVDAARLDVDGCGLAGDRGGRGPAPRSVGVLDDGPVGARTVAEVPVRVRVRRERHGQRRRARGRRREDDRRTRTRTG